MGVLRPHPLPLAKQPCGPLRMIWHPRAKSKGGEGEEFIERVGEQSSPTLSKHNPPLPMPSLVPDFAIWGRELGVGANE